MFNKNKKEIKNTEPTSQPNYDSSRLSSVITEYTDGIPTAIYDHKFSTETDAVSVDKEISLEQLQRKVHQVGNVAIESYMLQSQNTDRENRELLVMFMGWGGNVETDIARLELANTSAAHPDADILVINNPGSGESSALDRKTARKLRKTGDFGVLGEKYAEVIESYARNADKLTLHGASEGGLFAAGAAAALHDRIDQLIITDAPGSRKLGAVGLMNSFMTKEGAHAKAYLDATKNLYAKQKQQENDADAFNSIRSLGFKGAKQQFFDQVLAMGRSDLEAQLAEATRGMKENGEITFNSPELSELNKWQDVANIVGRISNLSKENPALYPKIDISHRVLKGATHSLGIANPTLFQTHTKSSSKLSRN